MTTDDLLARITLLEQHIDWLYANAGRPGPYDTEYATPVASEPEPQYPVSPAAMRMIQEGALIRAVKQVRAETGFGLKEAKDLVDRAARMIG